MFWEGLGWLIKFTLRNVIVIILMLKQFAQAYSEPIKTFKMKSSILDVWENSEYHFCNYSMLHLFLNLRN